MLEMFCNLGGLVWEYVFYFLLFMNPNYTPSPSCCVSSFLVLVLCILLFVFRDKTYLTSQKQTECRCIRAMKALLTSLTTRLVYEKIMSETGL